MIIFTVIGIITMAYIILAGGGLLFLLKVKKPDVKVDIYASEVPEWYAVMIVLMLFPMVVKKYLEIKDMKTE